MHVFIYIYIDCKDVSKDSKVIVLVQWITTTDFEDMMIFEGRIQLLLTSI